MKLFSTTPRRATVNYLRFTAQSNQLPKFIRRLTDQERGRLNFADGNPDLPWYGYFSAEADLLLWAENVNCIDQTQTIN